jgi:hypothetical protein
MVLGRPLLAPFTVLAPAVKNVVQSADRTKVLFSNGNLRYQLKTPYRDENTHTPTGWWQIDPL